MCGPDENMAHPARWQRGSRQYIGLRQDMHAIGSASSVWLVAGSEYLVYHTS